ncbi:MAG: ABC transporter permease [Planctomycetota bacterium]
MTALPGETQRAAGPTGPGTRVRSRPLGETLSRPFRWIGDLLSEAVGVVLRSLRPSTWAKQPIRAELVRQLRSCGVGTLPVVMLIALLTGLGIAQLTAFLAGTGSSGIATELAGAYLFESAGITVAVVVIIRAGAVNVVELATVRATGQDRMLLTHGIDPFEYFVVPRAVGLALSSLALNAAFVAMSLAGASFGLVAQSWVGIDPSELIDGVFVSLTWRDAIGIAIGSTLPAGLTGLIACRIGLSVDSALAEIPRVLPSYGTQALLTTFAVTAVASLSL